MPAPPFRLLPCLVGTLPPGVEFLHLLSFVQGPSYPDRRTRRGIDGAPGRRFVPHSRKATRVATINAYIAECEASWVTTKSAATAEVHAEDAHEDLLGEGDGWEPRPGEDRWLGRYLNALRGSGRVYVEVPVATALGGSVRRIDAVRLTPFDEGVRRYSSYQFNRDLQAAAEVEIIEVKRKLNRVVIGQLLVARDFAALEWQPPTSCQMTLLALVTTTDPALQGFCVRHGIRVEVVEGGLEDRGLADDAQ